MLMTIPLILLTCGLAFASAWISGHAEELAVQETPSRAWLPKAGFWLAVVGLSATLFAVLVPILTSFVNLETEGAYLNPYYFISGLWPLYLVISAATAIILGMLVNSVRAPKPKKQVDGSRANRRYGYFGYPRSYFIFMPMRSHRRIANSPRYYPAANGYQAAAGLAGASRGGMSGAASNYAGVGGVASGRGGMSGAASGYAGAGSVASGRGGMSGAAGGYAGAGSGRGGISSGSSSNNKKSYKSNNDRSMNGNAGLVMLAVMAIAGGYHGAKAVKKMGGKRQAEINHLWRTAEAQRIIREHDEEQERKLEEQYAAVQD